MTNAAIEKSFESCIKRREDYWERELTEEEWQVARSFFFAGAAFTLKTRTKGE